MFMRDVVFVSQFTGPFCLAAMERTEGNYKNTFQSLADESESDPVILQTKEQSAPPATVEEETLKPQDIDALMRAEIPIGPTEHVLQHRWTFWFTKRPQGRSTVNDYEKNLRILGSFATVEGFWRLYNHLLRPNELPGTSDYHLFKQGIKPMWEDPANANGGKWIIRLRKGLASKYWEEVILAIIGEQFDVDEDEICGCVVSVRYQEDIITVWNRTAQDENVRTIIQQKLNELLAPVQNLSLEYKFHDTSLKDNSSFRNPDHVVVEASANHQAQAPEHRPDGHQQRPQRPRQFRDFSAPDKSYAQGFTRQRGGGGRF